MLTDKEIELRILDQAFKEKKKYIIKQILHLKSHYSHLKEVYKFNRLQLVKSTDNSIGYPPEKSGTYLLPAPVKNSGRIQKRQPSVKTSQKK